MRIGSIPVALGLSALFTSIQSKPQENKGRLDVQVTRLNSTEGISGVTITLQGPYSTSSSSLFTPSPALTPDMRQYSLFAWESLPGTAYMSAEFMAPYETKGKAVTITEGAVVNSEVTLIK